MPCFPVMPPAHNVVRLYKHRSRLQAIASANSLICIPEGADSLQSGEIVNVQILVPRLDGDNLEKPSFTG